MQQFNVNLHEFGQFCDIFYGHNEILTIEADGTPRDGGYVALDSPHGFKHRVANVEVGSTIPKHSLTVRVSCIGGYDVLVTFKKGRIAPTVVVDEAGLEAVYRRTPKAPADSTVGPATTYHTPWIRYE